MKKIQIFGLVTAAALSIGAASCSISKFTGTTKKEVEIKVFHTKVSHIYDNLDQSIRLNVSSSVSNDMIYDGSNTNTTLNVFVRPLTPKYKFTPNVKVFAEEATTAYMRQMNFDLSYSADYTLNIEVIKFAAIPDGKNMEGTVGLTYQMKNEAGETVVPFSTVSSNISFDQDEDLGIGLGRAYADALRKINWDRIAENLKTAKRPANEKNAKVSGKGDTALEHTVIRWNILSSPQGADVSWRVISSTSDVANTNSNYIGTTPYESTESFDIKGLTYNNSGNVQIEISCEKTGYLTQRKRVNLRQAIDQKEISLKFNLIKDD